MFKNTIIYKITKKEIYMYVSIYSTEYNQKRKGNKTYDENSILDVK